MYEDSLSFGDTRRLYCEAKVGEDEQPPVRRDVVRAVQLVGGAAGGHPLAFRMLAWEEFAGRSLPSDGFLRTDNDGIVRGPIEELSQDTEPDARIRVCLEEPIPESAADAHSRGGTRPAYIFPAPRRGTSPSGAIESLWAGPFGRLSRLSSAWSEPVTVECSRAPSCAVAAAIIRAPVP